MPFTRKFCHLLPNVLPQVPRKAEYKETDVWNFLIKWAIITYVGNLSLQSFSSSTARRFQRYLLFKASQRNMG
jgi:hypothetical protein